MLGIAQGFFSGTLGIFISKFQADQWHSHCKEACRFLLNKFLAAVHFQWFHIIQQRQARLEW